jgi:hypothetical protein
MTQQAPKEFMDTVQLVPEEAAPDTAAEHPDFAATVQVESGVWPESPDFQSSESASLFAGTQPANLNVV